MASTNLGSHDGTNAWRGAVGAPPARHTIPQPPAHEWWCTAPACFASWNQGDETKRAKHHPRPPPFFPPPLQAAPTTPPACTACASTPLSRPPPVTVPFDSGVGAGSDDLPLDDPRVARPASAKPTTPEQILLLLDDKPGVVVSWATGEGVVRDAEVARPPAPAAVVTYGKDKAKLTSVARPPAGEKPRIYVQAYPNATYTSPHFHRVRLTGLDAGATYYYKVGSDAGGWSPIRAFRAPPSPATKTSPPRYPMRLVVVGDLGATINSTSTLDHIAASRGDAAILMGDYVYADNYTPLNKKRNLTPPNVSPNATYQPRWDAWGRLVSPVFGSLPFAPLRGNHEVETSADGKKWQSYTARLAPEGQSYYSTTIGPVHLAVLDTYTGWAAGTEQAKWLADDLAAVNRTATPWVIAAMHAPWYSSYFKHYKVRKAHRGESHLFPHTD